MFFYCENNSAIIIIIKSGVTINKTEYGQNSIILFKCLQVGTYISIELYYQNWSGRGYLLHVTDVSEAKH